jgi:predicted RNA polymerase sigma factor
LLVRLGRRSEAAAAFRTAAALTRNQGERILLSRRATDADDMTTPRWQVSLDSAGVSDRD